MCALAATTSPLPSSIAPCPSLFDLNVIYATCFLDEADGIIHDDVHEYKRGLPKQQLDWFQYISLHQFK